MSDVTQTPDPEPTDQVASEAGTDTEADDAQSPPDDEVEPEPEADIEAEPDDVASSQSGDAP